MLITKVARVLCLGCGRELTEEQLEKRSSAKFCSIACSRKYSNLKGYKRKYDETFLKNKKVLGYFLGFWVADGHMSATPKNYGAIYLTTSSKQLIDDIIAATGYTGTVISREPDAPRSSNIHINFTQYTLHYTGEIARYIQNIGYSPGKKRGKEFLPESVDDEMFPHFLRGFIDGDGSIYHDTGKIAQGYQKYLRVKLGCSNRSFLIAIHKRLSNLAIVRGGGLHLSGITYNLGYGHSDAARICRYIYADAPIKLERKYQKYLECKDTILAHELQAGPCTYPGCTRLASIKGLCKLHFDAAYHQTHKDDPGVKEKAYEAVQRYRAAHPDAILARRREIYAADPEKGRQATQAWRESNAEKIADYKQAYRQTHKGSIAEYKRRYRKEHPELHKAMDHRKYEKNKEKIAARAKLYYEKHKAEILAQHAAAKAKRPRGYF